MRQQSSKPPRVLGASSRRVFTFGVAAFCAELGSSARAAGAAPDVVRVAAPYVSLPVQVALAQGYFKAENLKVESTQFAGSRQAFERLEKHELDVLLTSCDNPINYRFNPHNALGHTLDVQILFGHDRGFGLCLVAQKQIEAAEGLSGKRVAVDAPDSGFAMTAFEMLSKHGLAHGKDYTVLSAGAFPLRLQGLREGKFEATMLNGDTLARARAEGFSVLARLSDVVTPYTGGVGVARESWVKAHPELTVRFIRAFYRAMRWLQDPRHRAAAIATITDAQTPPALAAQVYEISVDPNGLAKNAELNLDGLRRVLELRAKFGGFESKPDLAFLASPQSGLYDLGYYRRAVAAADARH